MKNINYKIVSIVLAGILLVTYSWHWQEIFDHKTNDGKSQMKMDNGMMNMTMSDMVKMMDGKTGRALEKEFIIGMIPHHQGAVDMANKLLQDNTVSPELKKFANDIIKAQEGEIKMMNEWLKKY